MIEFVEVWDGKMFMRVLQLSEPLDERQNQWEQLYAQMMGWV